MRLNPNVHALLHELDRAFLDDLDWRPLGPEHPHHSRQAALKAGLIKANGTSRDRCYRITPAGRAALGENAAGFMAGEPVEETEPMPEPEAEAAIPVRMISRVQPLPAIRNGQVDPDRRAAALQIALNSERDKCMKLFSLLVTTHSLASRLLLLLLASKSPELEPFVAQLEGLSKGLEDLT
jgi:hypothetical protein